MSALDVDPGRVFEERNTHRNNSRPLVAALLWYSEFKPCHRYCDLSSLPYCYKAVDSIDRTKRTPLNSITAIRRIAAHLQSRPDIRKIASNVGWLMLDRVLRFVLVILVSAWVVRYLGAEQYGYLSIAMALTSIAVPVIRLGLDTIIIQRLVDDTSLKSVLLGSAFGLRIVSSLVIGVLLVGIAFTVYADNPVIGLITLFMVIGIIAESIDVIDFWNQSQLKSVHTVLARSLAFLASNVLKVLAIVAQAPLEIFGLLYLVDSTLYGVMLVIMFTRNGGTLRSWRWNKQLSIELLKRCAPLIISAFAVSLYMRIDQIMLSLLLPQDVGERAVGIYSIAVRLSETWYFIPTAIIGSVFPMIIESKRTDEVLYRKRIQRLFNTVTLVSYVIVLPLTFTAHIIIDLLFGVEFSEATAQFVVLTWAGIWVLLGVARSYLLHTESRLSLTMWTTIGGAILNIVLNFALIPSLGGLGCAIATLIAQIITAHLSGYLSADVRFIAQAQSRSLIWPNPFSRNARKSVS